MASDIRPGKAASGTAGRGVAAPIRQAAGHFGLFGKKVPHIAPVLFPRPYFGLRAAFLDLNEVRISADAKAARGACGDILIEASAEVILQSRLLKRQWFIRFKASYEAATHDGVN